MAGSCRCHGGADARRGTATLGQPARGSESSEARLEKSRRIAPSSSAVHGSQQSQPPARKLTSPSLPPAWSSAMARWPADGWRWQVQAAAQRPRPQPEMTTVRPSSRTLPTWKTDGLRLLLTTGPPLDGSREAGARVRCADAPMEALRPYRDRQLRRTG